MNKKSVSAIIPAFNEEKTIEQVIKPLQNSPLIDEIICVNDGSTDNTSKVLSKFKNDIIIISMKKNCGKGFALSEGIKKAKGEIVLFLDADLHNLSENHLNQLLNPLFTNTHEFVIGYCVSKLGIAPFSEISGQRAYYKKDLEEYLEEMAETRFGVEVFLNGLFSKRIRKKIPLKGLRNTYQYEKRDTKTAIKNFIQMTKDMLKALFKRRGFNIFYLKRLFK